MEKKELELYIHIPFCMKKCSYCDFLSFAADERAQLDYVLSLQKELEFYGTLFCDREIATIFIGGGTPSWLNQTLMQNVLDTVFRCFSVKKNVEVTIECNPGTVTEQKFKYYKNAGINRLSIGLQSAQNEELKLLGRIHTYEQFLKTYELARMAGFSNINIDLMSSLPNQTANIFLDSLQKVVQLKPEHISVYSLMIEEGTPFFEKYEKDVRRRERGEMTKFLPNEEEEYQTTKQTQSFLKDMGYHWYEISNFAKFGYECRHNLGYWKRTEYLGTGLGAASLIGNVRYTNKQDFYEYLENCQKIHRRSKAGAFYFTNLHDTAEKISRTAQMEEFMFLGLRMCEGVARNEFEAAFGVPIEAVYGKVLKQLQQEGLLLKKEGRIFLTEKGMDLNNYAAAQFLLEN